MQFLASKGIKVPKILVSSDAETVKRFWETCQGKVAYKPVADATDVFQELTEDKLENLGKIELAPVHFEEIPDGQAITLALIGEQSFVSAEEINIPGEILRQCRSASRELDLVLSEFRLRLLPDETWMVTGFRPFPSPESISNPQIAETIADLLEAGR